MKYKKRSVKKDIRKNLEEKIFVNYFDTIKYKAIIYNNKGEQIAVVSIKRNEKNFSWDGRTYITNFECTTFFKDRRLFSTHKYFLYNINNPFPLEFNTENENNSIYTPDFDTEQLNIMLETKVIKDLNNVNKKLFGNIDIRTLMIIAVIIIGGYYLIKNGGFT